MAERFKPGVYFRDGKQVFLNDKGEVENPRIFYLRRNSLDAYNKYVKPILQLDFPSVLEPYTEARTKQIKGLQEVEVEDITNALSITVSEERQRKEIEDKKKKFNHPDAVNKFGKYMTYYQYEQKVKEEAETKVEIKQDETDVNKAFTERTGITIPKSYK